MFQKVDELLDAESQQSKNEKYRCPGKSMSGKRRDRLSV